MNLEKYGEPLAYEIAFWMQGFQDPDCPPEELGSLGLKLSRRFRSLGIIVLLAKADSDRFYHNLMRSGRVRLTYLQRLHDAGVNQAHHRVSGRIDPLLDAIASGDLELARRIAALLPGGIYEGHEYEDDYCYAQVLHRMIQETPALEQCPPFLERFEAYLEGEPNARLPICEALVAEDQDAFDEAFEAFLDEWEEKIAAAKERGQMEDPEIVAQRLVSVEGLAILRLAERSSLRTASEYRFCPSLARVPMAEPFPGE